MLNVTPSYYKNFKCIADKCKHNCCIGWEIDIDRETYAMYKNTTGDLDEKFRNCIIDNGDGGTFKLTQDERCPFLNNDGLCDIIINYGDDYLCEICNQHPRFINFFTDRIEKGIGLCCEAAADIILNFTEPVTFDFDGIAFETDDEKAFFKTRENIIKIMQNRDVSVSDRRNQIINTFELNCNVDKLNLCDFFMSLEILDSKWLDMLAVYKGKTDEIPDLIDEGKFDIFYEQLFVYFLFRHLSEAIYDGRFCERLKFCILSCDFIFDLCGVNEILNKNIDVNDFIDISRMYSAEIEYCEENTEKLLNYLHRL